MKYFRPLLLLFLAFSGIAVSFLATSCKKDPYAIGLDLLPPSDTLSVKTIDTVTVIAYSVLQDSIRTDETSTNMLGSLMDPYFGITTASFCTQFRLSAEAPSFGTDPVMDSLILSFRYDGIYGDSTAPQHIRVYELSNDIFLDSAYYSNRVPEHYGTPIADYQFTPDLKDSVRVGTGKEAAQLRIRLDKVSRYFGDKILYAPASALATNTSFIEFMKGLYIEAAPRSNGGGLVTFNMDNVLTKMTIYFHNSTGDSLSFDFSITSNCPRFNTFDHNGYINADPLLRMQVLNHDTLLGKNTLYVQGLGGIRTRVRLPFIKDLKKFGNIAINNAILVFKNIETDTTLAPPPNLNLFVVDSLGRIGVLLDSDEGTIYFDGTYNRTARTYKFRLTRQVQNILLGKLKNYDLYIMANNPVTSQILPNRVQLIGSKPDMPDYSESRMQLQVTYTSLH
ncbi:MAG TPA: DUF4270 domain-containing protein [Bacteroidales bacterium]|nr:DUF4270 domain-containing protein [Bacteroidales bacterium]